jgi:alpha-glucosidase
MPMDFMFTMVEKLSASDFRNQIALAESLRDWPVYVIGNMDLRRSYDRYGDGQHNDAIAKLMAGLYLTLRGTPILYYGEEIGMATSDPERKQDVKDPLGKVGWPQDKGRDGERTPMQWSNEPNGGFSVTKPWLHVPSSAKTYNVRSESNDPNSILAFYRQLLSLRHHHVALMRGNYVALNQDDPNVLSYLRRYNDKTVLVALNISPTRQTASFDLRAQGLPSSTARTLLSTSPSVVTDLLRLSLEPFSVYIAEITTSAH